MAGKKSIIIIGAGVAGLAAGCYGQMNGYDTQIFELHDLPGGLCTAWRREQYTFDGCLHYLFGSGEGQPFHQVLAELGAVQGRKMINHTELIRITSPDGRTLVAYSDPDCLETHMKELSSEKSDWRLIEQLANGVRQMTRFDMSLQSQKPRPLMTLNDWWVFGLKMLPFLPVVGKWAWVSAEELAKRFKDPFLQRAVAQMFTWTEIPVMVGLSILAYLHTGNAGFPTGGSLELVRAIERRYLELGGNIHYKSQVEKILVENDTAVGVRLYNDEEHRADTVISACDGRGTIFYMLGGKYTNRSIRRNYNGHLPIHSMIQVSLGVNRDFSGEPHWVTYLLDQPLLIGGTEHAQIDIKHYCFDPSLAPAGKSALVVKLRTNYDYWQRIYGHRLYDTEQEQVAQIVTDYLETRYPGLRAQTETIDVATPLSYERYTGNWFGSSCGWLLNKETMLMMMMGMPKTLPGLKNFYLAGQWVEPGGGVPLVATSGRNAIQLICAADGKPFRTEREF